MIACKIVEMPPKLITKLQRIVARVLFCSADKERQPFVISITPSKRPFMGGQKRESKGEKVSIMIKKIAIKQPTERIERVEFVTMSESVGLSVLDGKDETEEASFFVFKFRQQRPFASAPTM